MQRSGLLFAHTSRTEERLGHLLQTTQTAGYRLMVNPFLFPFKRELNVVGLSHDHWTKIPCGT